MKIIERIQYNEVVSFFQRVHPVDESSVHFAGNYWAVKHLEWANEVAGGVWTLCELDPADILGIVFSHHTAEGTEASLVSEQGMTLAQTLDYLRGNAEWYAAEHPICWAKMMYWQGQDFTPVALSTKPTPGKGRRSEVNTDLGRLFHQDGLHRLIRWGLDGRFQEERYEAAPKLTAFVSGEVE